MSRIAATFERMKREKHTGLVAYVTTGFPSLDETPALVRAMVDGGADLIELGIPFSDPLADGATVQRSTHAAVMNGVTVGDVLAVARKLRAAGIDVPLVAMGYFNPLLAYGIERFAVDAAAAGIDGVIPVDVPVEEAGLLHDALSAHGIDLIAMVAPTSTEERLARVLKRASGFVYCVSVTGTTGAREGLPEDLPAFVERVRRHTSLPLAVGFGVSKREHVARIGELCDAAVIGSAIIDVIERAPADQRAERLRAYVENVAGGMP